jgi:uncharacterized protein (DUF433 family)/DNA-binding transcriptional MerR regulator
VATITHLDRGCYEASRAAALSGVPERTVYWWADQGIVVPSVSPEPREKLWSYGDLLTLRLVNWLRKPKEDDGSGAAIARTSMREIRAMLERAGEDLWRVDPSGEERPTILVDTEGRIYFQEPLHTVDGQRAFDMLDLFAPFHSGPDLRQPRPHLRIVPGKVAGEPHLAHSRLTTRAVAALKRRGFTVAEIVDMYPDEDPEALAEALDLEQQLARAA